MKIYSTNIRPVVFCYSVIIALVLYQTGSTGSGTIAALVAMGLTFLSLLFTKRQGLGQEGKLLLFGTLYLLLTQMILLPDTGKLSKYLSQMFITAMMFSITITDDEHLYLKKVYEVSMVVYSVIIIRSIMLNPLAYVHASIPLFDALFDPNFIGLPIVLGTTFLLDDILHSSKKLLAVLYSVGFLVCVLAIVQTSSRGNLLGLAISTGLVVFNYLKDNRKSKKTYFIIALVMIAIAYMMQKLMAGFEDNFARMTDVGEGADNNRFYLWNHSIEMFLNNIMFGAGLGAVAQTYGHASHNTYLELLSETGIIGFIIYVTFFYKMFKKARNHSAVMTVALFTMFILIGFLNSLDNRCVWALMGWTAMLPDKKQQEMYIV